MADNLFPPFLLATVQALLSAGRPEGRQLQPQSEGRLAHAERRFICGMAGGM